MRTTRAQLNAVLAAAKRLLSAREDQMVTAEDWDALAAAVHGFTHAPHPHLPNETFRIDADGALVRSVTPARGEPYEHRCPGTAYYAAAQTSAELASGITVEGVHQAAGITWTEAAVALAFFKERGILVPKHGRTHAVAGNAPFEDAMTEYHALKDALR